MIRFALAVIVTSCVGAAFLFSACGDSSFTSTLVDDAAQADVAVSNDGSLSDALISTDGDGAPPVVSCGDAGFHTLCDSFDETHLSTMWTLPASCTQPFLDTFKSVSAPSSLATNDLDSGTMCSSVYADVERGSTTKFSSSFDLFVDVPNSDFEPFFSLLVTSSEFNFYELAFTTDKTGAVHVLENLTFSDGGSTYDVIPINAESLTLGAWNHLAIAINFAGSNSVSVSFRNSAPVALALMHRPTIASVSAYRLYLGVPNGGLGAKVEAHFDNFVCDVTP